jgi:hypothetical protein
MHNSYVPLGRVGSLWSVSSDLAFILVTLALDGTGYEIRTADTVFVFQFCHFFWCYDPCWSLSFSISKLKSTSVCVL